MPHPLAALVLGAVLALGMAPTAGARPYRVPVAPTEVTETVTVRHRTVTVSDEGPAGHCAMGARPEQGFERAGGPRALPPELSVLQRMGESSVIRRPVRHGRHRPATGSFGYPLPGRR